MKNLYLKRSSFTASLLLALLCFIVACKKETHVATTTSYHSGGTGTTGADTSSSDTVAAFNSPTALAIDAAGNIYVADYGNNLIRKISTTGIVSTLAGAGTQGDINGPANVATFNGPTGIAINPTSGNLYVADNNNNQIRMITPAGLVTTVAGGDSTGSVDGLGGAASFFGPEAVAVDASGNIFVADAGNNLIRKVTPAGQVSTLAGNANPGSTDGALLSASFNNPSGLTLDAAGNVYVADLLNNRIRKITLATALVSTLAGNDSTASINGTGNGASFYFPNSLAADASGNLYVTEYVTDLIRKVTPASLVSTFAGSGAQGQADSTGIAASFNGPSGIAVDAAGNVYVADTYNNVIRKITPAGLVSTIAGSGKAGANNGKVLSLRNAPMVLSLRQAKKATNLLYYILVKKRRSQ